MKTLSLMVLALNPLLCSCSQERVKETTYEILRNVELQQCQQNAPAECQRGENYREYQKRLKELNSDQ